MYPFSVQAGLLLRALSCVALCLLSGCGAEFRLGNTTVIVPTVAPSIWVGAWGNSPSNAVSSEDDNPGGTEQSFRFLVYPTIAGTQERVRFSNYFGTTPVTIGAARLALGQDGSPTVDTTHDAKLTFNGGSPSVTLAPGQIVVSDAVQVTYSFGQTLAVSMYVSGTFPALTRHNALFDQNYRTVGGAGDKTGDATGASYTQVEGDWLLLSGIDVYGQYQGTVVMLGSSTTDGFKSNYGSSNVYPKANAPVAGQYHSRLPDWLAVQLNANGYKLGVINAGIGGDTITPDTSNVTGHIQNAVDRLGRDVLAQPNVVALVSYLGSIDIRSVDCKSAPEIEAATQQMVAMAAAAKVRVILATIPPSAFCTNPAKANYGPTPTPANPYAGGETGSLNPGETQRMALNAWLRSTGATLPGVAAIADFDSALEDPTHPHFMLPLYNTGDNFHPNGAGYQAEGAVIPLKQLLAP